MSISAALFCTLILILAICGSAWALNAWAERSFRERRRRLIRSRLVPDKRSSIEYFKDHVRK